MSGPIVPVHHGPGWQTPRGKDVADYLYRVREDVHVMMRAVADVPDAVIVTGELERLHALLGAEADEMVASGRSRGHRVGTCAYLVEGIVGRLTLAGEAAVVAPLRELHAGRGEGRALVVVLSSGICVAKLVPETVDADCDPRAVVRGGQA